MSKLGYSLALAQNYSQYIWVCSFTNQTSFTVLPMEVKAIVLHSFLLSATLLLFCIESPISARLMHESDRLALLALKDGVIQDPLGALNSWNNSLHFCKWQGVTCGRQQQRVTILDLRSRRLVASLSPHIGNLSFLREIDLQNNSFHGEVPQELGNLSKLQYISLSNNSFSGRIPANFSHCSNLIYLCMASNNLQGKIPAEWSSLPKLVYINLRSNSISGSIPSSLGNLSSLEDISLSFNNVEGNIPDSIGKIASLKAFRVAANKLSGKVPPSLWNHSSIVQFYVVQNQLTGCLPPEIGLTLTNISNFGIAANQFSGYLPSSLSNASNLRNIEFSENNFIGPVPSNLGSLKKLKWINFSGNHLGSGKPVDLSFLASLTNCSNLEKLHLEDNRFCGVLPNTISNLSTKLEALALGQNQISGTIPLGIENLVNLTLLFLERNLLTGSIPVSIGKLHKLQRLTLQGNKLSGQIPPSLGSASKLYELRLEENNITGNIPLNLQNYQHLRIFDLSHNDLGGNIQNQVIGLSSYLIYLNLSQNSFTGSLPLEWGSLKNLGVLDISENMLTGEIPGTLGDCSTLERLYMDGNMLEGEIPVSLGRLTAIQDLDLSSNKLSGHIPNFLESFPLLRYLNLSSNQLEGDVPRTGVFRNASSVSIAGNSKLCGGIPELQLLACSNQKSTKCGMVLCKAIIPTSVVVVLGSTLIVFSVLYKRRKPRWKPSSASPLGERYLRISYKELFKATDGFSSSNLIGMGSFSSVYKGILHQDDEKSVAVKVLNLKEHRASKSFVIECEAMRKIRHRNLLKIVTSCSSMDFRGNEFKALVFEFMPNGNLENWLHPEINKQQKQRILNLKQRIDIAIDVATALDYLHHHCQTPLVHCDLKPSNVLLDDDMTAHVADFGLARFLSRAIGNVNTDSSCLAAIRGSIGYIPPEYGTGSELSMQGDVYSYGILLLEMIIGKRPTDEVFKDGLSLHSFSKTAFPERVMEVVDSFLFLDQVHDEAISKIEKNTRNTRIKACLVSLIGIGLGCSDKSPGDRMGIDDALVELHVIKEVYLGIGIHGKRGNELQREAGEITFHTDDY